MPELDDTRSKMVIVLYPRERKMNKAQIAREVAINAAMAMLSVADHKGMTEALLRFRYGPGESEPSLPVGWFMGGDESGFVVEIKRFPNTNAVNAYNTLYHWCTTERLPVSRGELDGEGSCMVIGPYWSEKIDELLDRAFAQDVDMRTFE